MPDSAKSPDEIEGVLAAVRRLVSEHQPAPAAPRTDAPGAAAGAPGGGDPLILTPALRVADPDDSSPPTPRPAPGAEATAEVAGPARASRRDEETAIDAETLREIIADVVHEEMRDVPGGWTARTAHKTARRGIRLALTLEELD